FAIALALYLAIAFLVQNIDLEGRYETAFTRIAALTLGREAEIAVGVIAATIILANLSGAIWAVSRMVLSLARQGYLPALLRRSRQGTPWLAVVATASALLAVTAADWAGLFGLDRMLAIAGQNF